MNLFVDPIVSLRALKNRLQVTLTLNKGRFEAITPGLAEAIPLPKLDGKRVEEMTRLLRMHWKYRLRTAIWYLYLDTARHRWDSFIEPAIRHTEQDLLRSVCKRDAYRRRLRPELLLCGCFTSSPVTASPLMEQLLPAADGLFLVWHPTGWLDINVRLRAKGQFHRLPLAHVLSDDPDDDAAVNWMIKPAVTP